MTDLIPTQVDYRADPSYAGDPAPARDDPRAHPAAGGAYQSPGHDHGFSTVELPDEAHQYNLMGNATQIGIDGWSGDSIDAATAARRATGSDV